MHKKMCLKDIHYDKNPRNGITRQYKSHIYLLINNLHKVINMKDKYYHLDRNHQNTQYIHQNLFQNINYNHHYTLYINQLHQNTSQ